MSEEVLETSEESRAGAFVQWDVWLNGKQLIVWQKRIIFICCVKEKTVVKTDIPLSIVNDWQTNAQKAPAKWAVDGIRCTVFPQIVSALE